MDLDEPAPRPDDSQMTVLARLVDSKKMGQAMGMSHTALNKRW